MDTVPLAIACCPLALYLLLLGAFNLRGRPTVINGAYDVAALALAVSGLAIVGPMNLFLPQAAADRFGLIVWPLLLAFYGLCIVLHVLTARPRLVVFNIAREQLRIVLEQVATRLDHDAQLVGDAANLPQLGLQFHLEATPATRAVSLVATGDRQSHAGWQRLEGELRSDLRSLEVSPNPRGFSFLAIGLMLVGWPLVQLLQTPHQIVAQQLRDMLRM